MDLLLWKSVNLVLLIAPNLIQQITYFALMIFWLLPLYKQYKGGYFIFFLMLGISDPIIMFCYYVLKLNPYIFIPYYIYAPFLLVGLVSIEYYLKKLNKIKIILAVLIFIALLLGPSYIVQYSVVIFAVIIFLRFTTLFFTKILLREIFYGYLFVLLFYLFTIILKEVFPHLLMKHGKSIPILVISNAIEIFIALFFTFFNLKNSPKIYLKKWIKV